MKGEGSGRKCEAKSCDPQSRHPGDRCLDNLPFSRRNKEALVVPRHFARKSLPRTTSPASLQEEPQRDCDPPLRGGPGSCRLLPPQFSAPPCLPDFGLKCTAMRKEEERSQRLQESREADQRKGTNVRRKIHSAAFREIEIKGEKLTVELRRGADDRCSVIGLRSHASICREEGEEIVKMKREM